VSLWRHATWPPDGAADPPEVVRRRTPCRTHSMPVRVAESVAAAGRVGINIDTCASKPGGPHQCWPGIHARRQQRRNTSTCTSILISDGRKIAFELARIRTPYTRQSDNSAGPTTNRLPPVAASATSPILPLELPTLNAPDGVELAAELLGQHQLQRRDAFALLHSQADRVGCHDRRVL